MNLHQLSLTPFRTPFYLRNPHVQSILPKFIHTPMPNYQRVLCPDSTGTTQVAYDFVYADKSNAAKLPIAVMFHGLEGGSDSHYAMAFANFAVRHGWNAVIVHFRGCGGMDNTAEPDYHAGDTAEKRIMFYRYLKPSFHTWWRRVFHWVAMCWHVIWASMAIMRCAMGRWWCLRRWIWQARQSHCINLLPNAFIPPIY